MDPIDVVDVEGPLDRFMVDFIIDSIADSGAAGSQAVILKIDSPAALVDLDELFAAVEQAPLPVIAWVGDAPAVAYGGALELASRAHLTIAAPSVELGYGNAPRVWEPTSRAGWNIDEPIEVVEPIPGLVDDLQAALGPLIVSLDGVAVEVAGTTVILVTAEEVTDDDGEVRQRVVPEVRFQEPGLFARTMRLPLLPEATFFFLVAGLTLVGVRVLRDRARGGGRHGRGAAASGRLRTRGSPSRVGLSSSRCSRFGFSPPISSVVASGC